MIIGITKTAINIDVLKILKILMFEKFANRKLDIKKGR